MKRLTRRSIAGYILLGALSLAAAQIRPSSSPSSNDESGRILSLENLWNQAEAKHDVRALDLLLAEPFEYTDSDGSFENRAEWLAHVKQEIDHYELLGNKGMAVHMYGNLAIVTGEYLEKLIVKGKLVARSGRFTDTWIQQGAEWKCVASQSTLIGP